MMTERDTMKEIGQIRRTRRINLVVFAAILIVLNVLGTGLFLRIDLTGRRIYSLSRASRDVVRSLNDRLTIKAYFSNDLPAQFAANARYIRDKLADYKAYARGMVHYEFTDPAGDETLQQEALQYGIQPVAVQVVERDKMEVKQIYMALAFIYEGRSESIPLVQDINGLEYDLTTTIRRVSLTELPVIGFLSGHGMATPEAGLSHWRDQLEQHYQVRTVSLDSFKTVPPDVTTLVLVGPTSGLSPWERYAVDQFIMNGGRTAWLLDVVSADLQQAQQGLAEPLELGMDAWLAHYGIRVRTALVMDSESTMIRVSQRQGLFQVQSMIPYPFFPQVRRFDRDLPLVKDLTPVTFFYVSPVESDLAVPDSVKATVSDTVNVWPFTNPELTVLPIAFTSENSSLQEGFFFIQPNPMMGRAGFQGGPYPVAAVVSGNFRSAFGSPPAVPDSVILAPQVTGPVENRLVVFGDATFATDDYVGATEGNMQLLRNLADWLGQDEALIGIRSKEVDYRPLKEISNAARAFVKWFNILVPPILAVLAGLFWWRHRRRRNTARLAAFAAHKE
jgi:gliding-associated putative ABC transporter substrate-binding component GldG